MRSIAFLSICLCCFSLSSQTDGEEKGALQMQIGWFGDAFVTRISGPQMEKLSGKDLPSWAPQQEPKLSEGSSFNLNAGYYTASFQKPVKTNSRIWWSAGASFLQRTITECTYSTDSIYASVISVPGNDSLKVYEKKSWNGFSSIFGYQVNLPVGFRLVAKDKSKRWIQPGLNLAPGFTFNHSYRESYSTVTYTAVADAGGPENSHFTQIDTPNENEVPVTQKIKGNYFNFYAGLPIDFCIKPARKWQFVATIEPGYQLVMLGDVTSKSSMMIRVGFGAKYVFRNS